MPEQTDPWADRIPLRREVEPEDRARTACDGSSPAHRRNTLVLPAPFGPLEQHDLAGADVRSAPASTGKPPSTATASRSSTTGAVLVIGAGDASGSDMLPPRYAVGVEPEN